MKIKCILLFVLIANSFYTFSQSYTIDTTHIHMETNNVLIADLSDNTYYNTFEMCEVSWRVVKDSMPQEWDFSFCFPNCYDIGVTSANNTFLANEQVYLNGHVYPNNKQGEGILELEITTNSTQIDTVTWTAKVVSISSVNNYINDSRSEIANIFDLNGRSVNSYKKNSVYFIEYVNKRRQAIYIID